MKRLTMSAFAVLTIAALPFISTSCGDSNKVAGDEESKDSLSNKDAEKGVSDIPLVEAPGDTTKLDVKAFEVSVNIRYVDMNKIMEKYNYTASQMKRLESKAKEFEQLQTTKGQQLQQMQNDIIQKQQNNLYPSQDSYDADLQNFQTAYEAAQNEMAEKAQALDKERAQILEMALKAIENYIIKYNESKKYDAILYKDSGIYFNPSLDITDEIINGLNSQK